MTDNIHPLAGYLRDSGGDTQELSIEQQKNALTAWAAKSGYVITRWFLDEARPGSSTVGRDGFQAMMTHFRHGADDEGVVIWKFSRFARDIDDSQFYKADLRRRGYKVLSVNDNIPDGPEGRFFEAALDWMNDRFLEDLATDVKRGLSNLVATYGAVPGTPPRGFIRQPVQLPPRRDGSPHIAHRWVPDPEWVPRIQQAFAMRAAGKSLAEISTATGLYKSVNCYATFFTNRIYIGILEYAGKSYPDYCEPLIDLTTWQAVQTIITNNARYGTRYMRRHHSRYLLSGLAYCAKCGSPLYGDTSPHGSGRTNDNYGCTRARRNRDCNQKNMPRRAVEEAVIAKVKEVVLDPEHLTNLAYQIQHTQHNYLAELDRQRAEQRARLVSIRRRIANVIDAISDTGNSRALTAKLATLEADEAEILAAIATIDDQATATPPDITPDALAAIAADLRTRLDSADPSTLYTILHGVVSKIIIDREETEIIGMLTYYYPPTPASDDIIDGAYGSGPLGGTFLSGVRLFLFPGATNDALHPHHSP